MATMMNHAWTHLSEGARSVHRLKIDDFSVTTDTVGNRSDCVRCRCRVEGFDWEIRFYPARFNPSGGRTFLVALQLVFLGEVAPGRAGSRRRGGVTAELSGRLVEYQNCGLEPLQVGTVSNLFQHPPTGDPGLQVYIGMGQARQGGRAPPRAAAPLTVECSITVLRDIEDIPPLPSSDLQGHLGELLQSRVGMDITFDVAGESFPAHKILLAARSPVFMAEFFGAAMAERSSDRVEIQDMDPAVFGAMLRFIYTDTAQSEIEDDEDEEPEAAVTMAQHLLVAADRYGLQRLKLICERRLARDIRIGTVASTLALAEQHSCAFLKDVCVEFIAGGSSENLDAVFATEGYKHLEATTPSVLTELVKAAHGNKRRRSSS